jgi:uncharacterized protein (TIGR03083 family)
MSGRQQVLDGLHRSFSAFGAMIDGLSPDQWRVQSLCPAWTVHGVVAHVTLIEEVLLGWRPDSGENPFAAAGAIAAQLAELSPADLVARHHTVVAARLAELDPMTDDDFAAASFTPVGQATYGRFMAIRVFDVWVHHRDITVPLGIPTDDGGVDAGLALDEVEGSIGYIAGKKIGVPDGQSIAFHVIGPAEREILVKVDGRAARVAELANPTATVTADTRTFIQLACGRIDPELAVASGAIGWSGDDELGSRAARNLAFTM